MNKDSDQRPFNMLRLRCSAWFWCAIDALEPDDSTEKSSIQKRRDQASGALQRAKLRAQERSFNRGRAE